MIRILLLSLILISCNGNNEDGFVTKPADDEPTIQPVQDCSETDNRAPVLSNDLSVDGKGSTKSTPEFSWDEATEDCEFSHYEVAIGTTQGGEEILSFKNIGDVTNFQATNLNLDYQLDYFFSLRAVDRKGNTSGAVVSNSFQAWSAKSLTDLVVWLDASNSESLIDHENDDQTSSEFSNIVKFWNDISESQTMHQFKMTNAAKSPEYDVVENGLSFNGNNQSLDVNDHADINLSVTNQRSIVLSFKTSSELTARQVLFEEGGTGRGINIYIEAGELYCGFWNINNDGDGSQVFTSVKESVSENTKYNLIYQFDYSHFQDANSTDGTVECFVDGNSIGQTSTTSRLHKHPGDIGLGAMNDGSFYHDGSQSGDDYYFNGHIFEFMIYNKAHAMDDLTSIEQSLDGKWN